MDDLYISNDHEWKSLNEDDELSFDNVTISNVILDDCSLTNDLVIYCKTLTISYCCSNFVRYNMKIFRCQDVYLHSHPYSGKYLNYPCLAKNIYMSKKFNKYIGSCNRDIIILDE